MPKYKITTKWYNSQTNQLHEASHDNPMIVETDLPPAPRGWELIPENAPALPTPEKPAPQPQTMTGMTGQRVQRADERK